MRMSASPQGFECDIVAHAIGVPLIEDKRKNGQFSPFCSYGGAMSKIFEH